MIRILRSGFLTFYKNKFKCSFGKNGFTKNKREGDLKTPLGHFKIIKCYYRPDRVKKPITKIKCIQITKNMGWCDDPLSPKYNKLIRLPYNYHYEKLFKKDHTYDLILVLNYNLNPVKKLHGSAIFIHIAKRNFKPTLGCIALQKEDLIIILKKLHSNTVVKII